MKAPKSLAKRGCTDILCLLAFIAIVGTIFGLGIMHLSTGNIDGIIYPSDYNGNYCGKSGTAVADKPYAWYPQLDTDIKAQAGVLAVGYWWDFVPYTLCVKECPAKFSFTNDQSYGGCDYEGADCGSGDTPRTFYASFETTLMLKRCFPLLEVAKAGTRDLCSVPDCKTADKPCIAVDGEPEAGNETVWEMSSGDSCERTITETITVQFTPQAADDESYELTQQFAGYITKIMQASRAVDEAWTQMGVCILGGTIVMGFFWVLFLWLFAGVIVFVAFGLLVICLFIVTIGCYIQAGWAPNLTDYLNSTDLTSGTTTVAGLEFSYDNLGTSDYQTSYQVLSGIMTVILVLVVIMLIVWRKCIVRCIAIIRESTKVFKTVPGLIIWPLLTIAGLTLVMVFGLVVGLYIFFGDASTYKDNLILVSEAIAEAANTSSTVDSYLTDETASQWVFFVVHVFGVLWAIEFIKACAWITMSGAVCYWYFFKNPTDHPTAPGDPQRFPLLNAFKRTVIYHMGSAAFGALIIAICQLIRYILATIDYYTKDLQQENFLYKMAIKCAQCAMWCLQKTIEFISYFGFVFIALEGQNFCQACKNTFVFLLEPKNAAQAAVNKTVEKLIVLIISWTTPTLMSLVCYGWLFNDAEYMTDHVNNPLYPAILVWIGSFFIADAIATVFECTIDTIFLCSFQDSKEYGGKYMSPDMREAFGLDVAEQEAAPIQTSKDFKEKEAAARKKSVEIAASGPPPAAV
jgi:hypothetical protein